MPRQEIAKFLSGAIEASVYVSPRDPGLTLDELHEVGSRLGLKNGEINDALASMTVQAIGRDRRLMLERHVWQTAGSFAMAEDPELRDIKAFDFVVLQLNERAREVGLANACLDRSVILARAEGESISRHNVEVAITVMLLAGLFAEDDAGIRYASPQGGERQLPSAIRNHPAASRFPIPKQDRASALTHVRDVVERRVDGRSKSAEPLGAFAEYLQKLGYGHFRLWWTQTVAELGRTDPNSSPLSASVLAAALVEGALTFVVKHARSLGISAFASGDFDKEPKSWRIEALVASAARGGPDAILDSHIKTRTDGLIRIRQRIHAGRMLSEFPGGAPDLRPEEAREARAVAEQVVRRILEWLELHPPSSVGAAEVK
jgi:hypothetical protein